MAISEIVIKVSLRKYCLYPSIALLVAQYPLTLLGKEPWLPACFFKVER